MLFAIISEDVPNSLPLRQQARPEHLARLEELSANKRLVLAGPHPLLTSEGHPGPGFSGSLIVADFESEQAARLWAETDPYVAAGVYQQVVIKPFKQVFP